MITYKVVAGDDIFSAIKRSIEKAKRHKDIIKMEFNRTQILTDEFCDPNVLADYYVYQFKNTDAKITFNKITYLDINQFTYTGIKYNKHHQQIYNFNQQQPTTFAFLSNKYKNKLLCE